MMCNREIRPYVNMWPSIHLSCGSTCGPVLRRQRVMIVRYCTCKEEELAAFAVADEIGREMVA